VLTDDGRDLAEAMAPLIGWGVRRLGELEPGETFRARSVAVAMVSLANREGAAGVREAYQYVVGDSAFYFSVDDGSVEVHDGRAEDPAVVVTTDEETFAEIASGNLAASEARESGALTIAGTGAATKRLRKIFGRSQIFPRLESDRRRRTAVHS
jgi:putative sterol carrier protein